MIRTSQRLLRWSSKAVAVLFIANAFSSQIFAQTSDTVTAAEANQIKIREITVADVKGANLTNGAIYSYRSEDDVQITRTILDFKSAQLASREFEKILKKALKVVGQSTIILPNEPGVTRRSVVMLAHGSQPATFAVIRLSNVELEKFESKIMRYAIALEKQVDQRRAAEAKSPPHLPAKSRATTPKQDPPGSGGR